MTPEKAGSQEEKPNWLVQYVNRSYLTKWVIIGVLIGIVAGFGATIFYYMIELVSNTILGGITGFYPPNPVGEASALVSIASPRYYLIPISTIIGGLVAGLLIFIVLYGNFTTPTQERAKSYGSPIRLEMHNSCKFRFAKVRS